MECAFFYFHLSFFVFFGGGFIESDVTSSASLIRLELALPLCRRIVVAPRSIHSLARRLALGSLAARKRSAGAFSLARPTPLRLTARSAIGLQAQGCYEEKKKPNRPRSIRFFLV